MPQPTTFLDCRGLSNALTVLRIKQAMIGRADCGLPIDVLVDGSCCDAERVSASLTGESTDVQLLYCAESNPEMVQGETRNGGVAAHV